jgi:Protein of unknown function (DUF3892)
MNEYQVICVRKPDRMSSHEHITAIGVATTAGTQIWDRDSVIRRIDGNEARFYTLDSRGRRIYVYVARVAGRHPWLQTYADNQWGDNLLSLDECR